MQAGDKLQVRQRQHGSASGGINLNTDQAASSDWSYQGVDQDGMSEQQDTTPDGEWHDRIFDISGMAGNHITVAYFCDLGSGAGAWSIDFTDFAIVSADGGVHPIYTGAGGIGMGWWGSAGMTNNGYTVAPVPTDAAGTRYYADDHLGTARMEFSSGGWPVWSGTFAPYGEEINPQATANNYKFTGKERDAESGEDYFGARYFSSTMGRFMSPDWAAKAEPVPYAKLDNPQSLNIYAYVLNNPLRFTDADGHNLQAVFNDLKAAATQLGAKVTVGLGVGAKVKVGSFTARLEGAVKANVSFSDGKLAASRSADLAATAGSGKTQVGLGGSVEKVDASVDLGTGESGGGEPATGEKVIGISQGNSTAKGSTGGLSIGGEEGEVILGGGELSITKEGLGDLKAAWTDLKTTVSMPPPPPPASAPAPPLN